MLMLVPVVKMSNSISRNNYEPGKVRHAMPVHRYQFGTKGHAICGEIPSAGSNGFTIPEKDQAVTCEDCQKIINEINCVKPTIRCIRGDTCAWQGNENDLVKRYNARDSRKHGVDISDYVCPKCGCKSMGEIHS
jgi:hypothetical protein